jgi:hypothetical protein
MCALLAGNDTEAVVLGVFFCKTASAKTMPDDGASFGLAASDIAVVGQPSLSAFGTKRTLASLPPPALGERRHRGLGITRSFALTSR